MSWLFAILLLVLWMAVVAILVIPHRKWRIVIAAVPAGLVWLGVLAICVVVASFNSGWGPGPGHIPVLLSGALPIVWLVSGWVVIGVIAVGVWRSWWSRGAQGGDTPNQADRRGTS